MEEEGSSVDTKIMVVGDKGKAILQRWVHFKLGINSFEIRVVEMWADPLLKSIFLFGKKVLL